MKFKQARERPQPRIEIIPMIDTIFFLLVFFMLSSLSLARVRGILVDLPDARTGAAARSRDAVLSIGAGGRLELEGRAVAWRDLQRELAREIERRGGAQSVSLLLNADERVAHGTVVRALDTARDLGVTRYGIATDPAPRGSQAPQVLEGRGR